MDWFGDAEVITLNAVTRPIALGAIFGLLLALAKSLPRKNSGGRPVSFRSRFSTYILPALGYAVPVALVGYIAGYLTGASRSAAVGSTVPAVLALIGGLNIYFFGTQNKEKAVVAYSIFIFAFVFFYGVWGGAVNREVGRVERMINLAEQERSIRIHRENRNMSPEPPAWILGTDPR